MYRAAERFRKSFFDKKHRDLRAQEKEIIRLKKQLEQDYAELRTARSYYKVALQSGSRQVDQSIKEGEEDQKSNREKEGETPIVGTFLSISTQGVPRA